jgi:hypothetical protein
MIPMFKKLMYYFLDFLVTRLPTWSESTPNLMATNLPTGLGALGAVSLYTSMRIDVCLALGMKDPLYVRPYSLFALYLNSDMRIDVLI